MEIIPDWYTVEDPRTRKDEEEELSVATNRNTNSKINKFLERGYEIVDSMVD